MPILCDYIRIIQIILAVQVYLLSINISGFENGPVTDLCLLTVILQIAVCVALLVPLVHCVRECIHLYRQKDSTMSPMEERKQEIEVLLPDMTEESHEEPNKKGSTQVGNDFERDSSETIKGRVLTPFPACKRPSPIKTLKVKERAASSSKDRNSTPISALCAEIRKGFTNSESSDSEHESDSTPVSTLCDSILKDFAHLGNHIEASSPAATPVIEPSDLQSDHVAPLNLPLIHSEQLLQKETDTSLKPEPLAIPRKRPNPRRRPPPLQLDFDLLPRPLKIVKKQQ